MSKLYDYLKLEANWMPMESDESEITDIVLEKAGFKWIPTSERLPEISDVYIVTATNFDFVLVMAVRFNNIYKDWDTLLNVIAWMPRPEPYEPKP